MDSNEIVQHRQIFDKFRRPMGFNYVHFLLIHLYNLTSTNEIKSYPLYSIYVRCQQKLNLNVSEDNQSTLINAIEQLVNENNIYLTETVEQTHLNYTTYPILCLFRLYSPMHLILLMEPMILLKIEHFKNLIQILFANEYSKDKCDYIHFCIAHRKTDLLRNLLSDHENQDNWLTNKINSPSDRSWLPIHYAAYIADEELIRKLCEQYSHLMSPLNFILPQSHQQDFSENPFDYLLRASGMKLNTDNPTTHVHDDNNDNDDSILPIMIDDEDDDGDQLFPSVNSPPTDSTNEQQAMQTALSDIPDADQLESSVQYSRDSLLRYLTGQTKGLVYFLPSPLLLASICPLNDNKLDESYSQIVRILLDSKLVDIDGLNHNSLTRNTIEYFSRHKYANLTCTKTYPYIFYQCDALFTSTQRMNASRISNISDDRPMISKLIYFLTVLNQRTLFSQMKYFDQYLLHDLLELHENEIEKIFDTKLNFTHFLTSSILRHEQINELTVRILIRYFLQNENQQFEIDVHYFFIDSYIDQFVDAYVSLFHTPILVAVQNRCLPIVETLFSNISSTKTTHWGILNNYEIETCLDQLFSRREKISFDDFKKFLSIISNISIDDHIIQQRIFVHTLVTCIRMDAKTEYEYLIENYAKIFYDSCFNYSTDIRHNILAYCVVRNHSQILEILMSTFSLLNYNSSELSILPLSNLNSSTTHNQLREIFNQHKIMTTLPSISSIYSFADDYYRQCRRIRNTAIAKQERRRRRRSTLSTSANSMNLTSPRPSRFWNAVRSMQMNFQHRNQYARQINSSDDDHHQQQQQQRATTLQTVNEEQIDKDFQRIQLEIAEPIYNELPMTTPVVPKPIFISLVNADQDDEQEVTPVNGQTLLHLAAKIPDHEDVVRVLMGEHANMTVITNSDGQIPLLCAIQGGSTLSAQLLLEADPHSITTIDKNKSSVFHYCCQQKDNVLLANLLNRLKRLSSNQSVRIQALQNLIEPNSDGQTPFSIACQKGSIRCVKQIFDSKWLLHYIHLANLITSDGIKRCIDDDQFDIIIYLVSDLDRFRVIIKILIDVIFTEPYHPSTDVVVGRQQYNVLEYAILLKKPEFVKIFVSVPVPRTIEKKPDVDDRLAVVRSSNVHLEETVLYDEYKCFLTRYSLPFKYEQFNRTPIQRMLANPIFLSYIPNLLDQFTDNDGMDLSVIDDCLCSKPRTSRCIFGRINPIDSEENSSTTKNTPFSPTQWIKEHPLNLITQCDYAPIYEHPLVLATVDSKADLFGNLLYLFILIFQAIYVALYTGVALQTRTPKFYGSQYIEFDNVTCLDMCHELTNSTEHFDYEHQSANVLNVFRLLLLIFSCIELFKELIQIFIQRGKYFRAFFINILEIITYTCGILFSIDLNSCSKYSSIRCKFQYDLGALGIASVWTVLLLVVVNSLKLGKYGLLFITICLTFAKFCFIYVFIWIGYLFAFHMLLTENPAFDTILTAIPRMISMLTGEFNFENLFYTDGVRVQGTTMAKIIFTAFVFIVHICVMNILIGLAVENVHEFQSHARTENLRSRIRTVLSFQSKFGQICRTASKFMFALGRYFPNLLSALKIDVSKVTLHLKPISFPNRSTHTVQCRIGYVATGESTQSTTHSTHQKDTAQEMFNDKIMSKVNELQEDIHKTQLRFTQELHRLTIDLSKMIEK